ncbi:carboxypeptidase regulatory-like domain-containing protein [Streptomyces sp. NPDC004675]|uniref:carboxypeptidase regulatory-like domain-containing protein n=1 Tax=Streptomyces sp. NPDC004675 TaxID=3154286 RepID=UPI0033BCE286
MFRRGRTSAPVSALLAACLGLGMLIAGPTSALAASPAQSATVQASSQQRADAAHLAVPPQLASVPPAYTPAGCNAPDPSGDGARCQAMIATNSEHRVMANADGPAPTSLTPKDIRDAYRLPDGGEGQTVALIDAFGYSKAEEDLAHYREQFGLPECTSANGCFRKVDQRGGTDYPTDNAGWAEETALDLDAVSSACPKCHILLVEADINSVDDLGEAAETAVRLGAKFVSNSYGVPGEFPEETGATYYDHPGVVITASSGDAAGTVLWPSSDPNVVAVGGTRLTRAPETDRGWTEAAWNGAGSGCSLYEPQPAYQADLATDCAMRATADIAADADPASGLAVYDTLGEDGWLQVGGTSLASPLVAAMYALAGTPAEDAHPVTYPYADQGNHVFDVTRGSSGTCATVLCDAGPGWDGPTGLGTPNGVEALKQAPNGTVTGHVTDQATGAPLSGASVVLTGKDNGLTFHGTTDSSGAYHVSAAAGAYGVTASRYGYGTSSPEDVTIALNSTRSLDVSLAKVPSQKITGKITDGSGHGWPLYAKITVAGYPDGPVYTDPKTGTYSVELPRQADYTLHVTPVYPGYETTTAQVSVGTSDVRRDVSLGADLKQCSAPGYAYAAQADFENWSGTASQHGWTAADNGASGHAWEFDSQQWNLTDGTGNFAVADPFDHDGAAEDAVLTTPAMDLTHNTESLQFDTAFLGNADTSADVALSTDGGETWASVWHQGGDGVEVRDHVSLPLTAARGHDDVKIRFHFTGKGQTIWELDNITVGTCAPVAGGLVSGTVRDGNTGLPIDGATVTPVGQAESIVSTATTPNDPNLSDGFYWMFRKDPGKHTYTTAANRYTTATTSATTAADAVTTHDITLRAGQLKVTPATVLLSGRIGDHSGRTSGTVTLTNTGLAPLHITLGEQNTGYTTPDGRDPALGKGAPRQYVKGTFPTGPITKGAGAHTPPAPDPAGGTVPTPDSWQSLPNYPEQIMDNAIAGHQGKTYSLGGTDKLFGGSLTAHSYVYDPATTAWSRIADLPQALAAPSAAFVDGTLYETGGWALSPDGTKALDVKATYAYDTAKNTWSRKADLPTVQGSAATAVLDGQLYVIGGCSAECTAPESVVYRYSPQYDRWTRVADLPVAAQWSACAGLGHEIVCAGGVTRSPEDQVSLSSTYAYNPHTDVWTRLADLPHGLWGGVANGANGELQVAGGVVPNGGGSSATNETLQYDPVTNTWRNLPNAPSAIFRSSSSGCGVTEVGGASLRGFIPVGTVFASSLPGYTQCGGEQVSWLSENRTSIVLAPGQSARVRISGDATVLTDPGNYRADLDLTTDSPYVYKPVAVTFHVTESLHHRRS